MPADRHPKAPLHGGRDPRDPVHGADIWHNGSRSYDLALTCTFRDMDAVAVYDKHPFHEKQREYIYAHRVDGKTVIYEVPDEA